MSNSQPFIMFDQESAKKSGGSDHLQDGGAYICTIKNAKYVKAKTDSHGVELSVLTSGGQKANYLTIYYAKADGSEISGGRSLLNALMGLNGLQSLSFQESVIDGEKVHVIPELLDKTCGLFLQKALYAKGDKSEGYKFEIRCPFDATTNQTFKEKCEGGEAKAVNYMTSSYKDKDERKAANENHSQQQAAGAPVQNGGPQF